MTLPCPDVLPRDPLRPDAQGRGLVTGPAIVPDALGCQGVTGRGVMGLWPSAFAVPFCVTVRLREDKDLAVSSVSRLLGAVWPAKLKPKPTTEHPRY